jgi:hypothetical protein
MHDDSVALDFSQVGHVNHYTYACAQQASECSKRQRHVSCTTAHRRRYARTCERIAVEVSGVSCGSDNLGGLDEAGISERRDVGICVGNTERGLCMVGTWRRTASQRKARKTRKTHTLDHANNAVAEDLQCLAAQRAVGRCVSHSGVEGILADREVERFSSHWCELAETGNQDKHSNDTARSVQHACCRRLRWRKVRC